MTTLADLSLEIVECILFALDPVDVARVSQASRFFYEIVYGPLSRQFWRGLYLAQLLDDPRCTTTHLGRPRDDSDVDWQGELQRIIRARTVVTLHPAVVCLREERCTVLRTCIDLLTHVPPIRSSDSVGEPSHNVRWIHHLFADGDFLARESWTALLEEEDQLLARLHVLYGLTRRDLDPERRRASQAFVYSLRHHTSQRAYGPFMPDERTRRIDWVHVWMLMHDFGTLLMNAENHDDDWSEACADVSPFGLLYCQSNIPRGLNLDLEVDWAGVEGLWSVRYGSIDHREFLLYNDPSVPDHEPLDATIFDDGEEVLASINIYFRVAGVEPDPAHPTRPKINFVGEVDGRFNVVGFVKLTDDDQLWWHHEAGNDNQMVWSADGIGLGNVRSRCGAIGVWSTIFHDNEDPIGPFWLHRALINDDE